MLHQILTSGNFWFIFIVVVIVAILRQPAVKGWMGELMVRLQGKMFLDKTVYHEIHNVTIPADEGQGTTQIDHVYVSKYGIFVVETKNMGGWIFGNEHDAMWTQKLNPNHSQKFQNPLRQNYKHTKTLAGLLDLPANKMISVVVFNGDNTKFKTPTPDCVCYSLGYIDFIKKHKIKILGDAEVERVLKIIEDKRLAPGFKTHRDHVAYVKDQVAQKRSSPGIPEPPAPRPPRAEAPITPPQAESQAEPICPRCGSKLIRRTAKQGANAGQQFWGCSAYPKCRHIIQV
jgi:hypothetical protein